MKANELMVDDWVLWKGKPVQVAGVSGVVYEFGHIDITLAHCNDEKLLETHDIKSIQPITLTPEILEKNGFSGKMYAICQIDKEKQLQFYYHEHRLKLYWTGIDEYNNHSKVTDEIFRCHCHYVHELQHALKLCGIEKTIEL